MPKSRNSRSESARGTATACSNGEQPGRINYVRYETREGVGLFQVLREFDWTVGLLSNPRYRSVRIPKARAREILDLYSWLSGHTSAPPRDAYDDRISREPATWYRACATEHLRHADRLCDLLRMEGLDLRRVERQRLHGILWCDAETIVTRRERGKGDTWADPVVKDWLRSRRSDRRKKQARRKQAAENRKARDYKSSR